MIEKSLAMYTSAISIVPTWFRASSTSDLENFIRLRERVAKVCLA